MRYTQRVLELLAASGVAAILAACSSSGSSSGNVLPSAAGAPISGVRAEALRPNSGGWDIAVYDDAFVPGLPEKVICSESPSGSCAPVQKKDLKNSASLSDAYGSASFKSVTKLGSLIGSGKASLAVPGTSALAVVGKPRNAHRHRNVCHLSRSSAFCSVAVKRLVLSGAHERKPDRVLADKIGAYEAERRPGTGEVRLTTAKNKRTKVQMILVDKTEVGKTRRKVGPGNGNDAVDL